MSEPYISTIDKIKTLLQETSLSASQLVAICEVFGIKISNAKLSRALADGSFTVHRFDEEIRPLILKLEDLVERFAPAPISFEDVEHIQRLFVLLDIGVDLGVGTRNTNSSTEEVQQGVSNEQL
jgi:hypothetical protein